MSVTTGILLVLVNIIAWGFFHLFISYLCFKIPLSFFLKENSFFKIKNWERSGKIWQNLLLVKKWKGFLIDGSSIARKSYDKSHLHGTKEQDLLNFAAETKRAELTHWLLIVPAPLFFLWNPIWAGWIMIVYALIANLPFIIVQRYNRGRIEFILKNNKTSPRKSIN